jgi:hypothetical protein
MIIFNLFHGAESVEEWFSSSMSVSWPIEGEHR